MCCCVLKRRLSYVAIAVIAAVLNVCAQDEYADVVGRAMVAMEQDSLAKAEGLIREGIHLKPADKATAVLYQYLGEICVRQKRDKEALQAFTDGLALQSGNENLLIDRASLFLTMGVEDRALTDLDVLLRLNPDHAQGLFFRAYVFRKKHLMAKARRDYEHLIVLENDNREARIALAMLNADDNRPQEAMEQADVVVRYWPEYATGWIVRGGLHQKRLNFEMALHDMNEAIRLEPGNPDFYVSRAILYRDFKKKALAREDFAKAVRLGADPVECASLMLTDRKGRKAK